MKRVVLSIAAFILLLSSVIFAVGWEQDGSAWKYKSASGDYLTDVQKAIDGKWYMFDENGHLVTGFYEKDDKFYYFKEDGSPANGPIIQNGKTYQISNKGEVKGISQEEFHAYQDAMSQLYITGGGYSPEKQTNLDKGLEEAKTFFNVLPLSKRAFKLIFAEKGMNNDGIEHALKVVNINWKEQALKCAKEYYDKSQLDRDVMKSILLKEGFADIEANYGTEMAFGNDTLSSGVGKKSEDLLMKDYLDKMSLSILGQTWTQVVATKNAAKVTTEATVAATTNADAYTIKNKTKKTFQVNLTDDDEDSGKVVVKLTLPVPEFDGSRATELNNLMNIKLFGEVKDFFENNYYEYIRSALKYNANSVMITSQDANELKLSFESDDIDALVVVDLNTMNFKNNYVK